MAPLGNSAGPRDFPANREPLAEFTASIQGTWTVAVLCGGESSEREISLASGANVAAALRARGHNVRIVDPAECDLRTVDWRPDEIALIALHGAAGEDGRVQRQLEECGIPYTGSGPETSQLGMNKSAAKERFAQFQVPTPKYALIHQEDPSSRIRKLANELTYPVVVKPNSQGSSLGVSLVRSENELPEALKCCFQFDPFGLIEHFIPGEEWTVAILDQEILPPLRIETEADVFSYAAKYQDEQTRYEGQHHESTWKSDLVSRIALKAAQALGTTGLSRVDLRVDPAGIPWVLEVNTVPGLTEHSLVPQAAQLLGWNMGELCERIVQSGWRRRRFLKRSA